MDRIRKILIRYSDIIVYIFFGGLTTLVNFLVYFPLYNWLNFSGLFSNVIAWIAAVIFAFLTNKPFVFKSNDWSLRVLMPEFSKFVGCRIASGMLESAAIWLLVDFLLCNGNIVKIILSVVVVIINYISSKWVVFKPKDEE